MAKVKICDRNSWYEPYLTEGVYLGYMPKSPPASLGEPWFMHLKPYERLYYHQTLNSVRKSKRFISTPQIPTDSLNFQLQARYDHSHEAFPDRGDIYLQRETCAYDRIPVNYCNGWFPKTSFRALKNVKTDQLSSSDVQDHPLKIGGIKEKISPHSIKLMNSGIHTQLVNNGFSRQSGDGNFFRY